MAGRVESSRCSYCLRAVIRAYDTYALIADSHGSEGPAFLQPDFARECESCRQQDDVTYLRDLKASISLDGVVGGGWLAAACQLNYVGSHSPYTKDGSIRRRDQDEILKCQDGDMDGNMDSNMDK